MERIPINWCFPRFIFNPLRTLIWVCEFPIIPFIASTCMHFSHQGFLYLKFLYMIWGISGFYCVLMEVSFPIGYFSIWVSLFIMKVLNSGSLLKTFCCVYF